MRKLTIRMLIAAMSFMIGIAAVLTFGWLLSMPLNLVTTTPAIAQVIAPSDAETKALDVTVCDLKKNPAKYNHSLVKLTGYFSRGFEDSTLYDPGCDSRQWIWVELGGSRSVGVMLCCGVSPSRTRDKEVEVEGIKLPLTEDDVFTRYDKLLADGKLVKATVVGTFFSGTKQQYYENGPVFYGGYGHMGIGSLFIVQQVLSADLTKMKNK